MKGMTPDAKTTLRRVMREQASEAGLTRRQLLKGSGALIVTFSMAATAERLGLLASAAFAQGINGAGNPRLDSWIAIGTDGRVTAYTGKCELGQGLFTAQTQLIAEELSVPVDRVTLIQCDTSRTPDQGTTSGAQSHPANFNDSNLALAGATARETLLQLASTRLGVAPTDLVASGGSISVRKAPSRTVSYGELIGGKTFNVPLNRAAKRKPVREWTVLGTSVKRLDLPSLVTGETEFVHNVRVPGMRHGRVIRPPSVGATLMSVDEGSVRDLPGSVRVVVKKNFVGVVADKEWQAIQAAATLKVAWSAGTGLPSHADFYSYLRNQTATRDTFLVDSKDVDAKLASSAQVVRATYFHPYQMHGALGSSCAVADVQSDKATIWSATQAVYPLRNTTATILGLPQDTVRIVFSRGSGCYGINGADTVSFDAALLSQAVGRPVRVQLTRKDEMAWENYGFAFVLEQRVGLDAMGNIVTWDHESWNPTRGGRPGYDTPGNVVTGMLAGFPVPAVTPRRAPEPTQAFNNGNNAAPSYVTGCVGGACGGQGTVRSERVLIHTLASPFWTGPLRSPQRLQNTFAHESFIDEVAARLKADPVAYRLRHISDRRLIEVVNAAAKAASWAPRPSPRPALARTGVVSGRGMACVLYEGDNGYASMVADVEVNQSTGVVRVTRLVVALDCGPVSNPDGVKNQIEGGAVQGLSRALGEEVTWDNEKVTSVDWKTYQTLDLGFNPPVIESVLINRTDVPATGAGETSITVVAPAVANAIFDATGARIRQVPFTPARVKAALDART